MSKYAIQIPKAERNRAFLVNRVEGMSPIHYGSPLAPMCVRRPRRPWLTSWFIEDVTCKRCAKACTR